MIGYCEECGAAIYTMEDVGKGETTDEVITEGVIPHVIKGNIKVRHLVCRACIEDEERAWEAYLVSPEADLERLIYRETCEQRECL